MLQMALRVFLSSNHQSFWFSMLQVLVSCCLGICPCLSGSQTCWCTVVPGDVSDLFPCEVCQFSFLSRALFTGVTCSVLAEPKSGFVCLERQLWFASLWWALSFFLPLCSDLDFSPYLYIGTWWVLPPPAPGEAVVGSLSPSHFSSGGTAGLLHTLTLLWLLLEALRRCVSLFFCVRKKY